MIVLPSDFLLQVVVLPFVRLRQVHPELVRLASRDPFDELELAGVLQHRHEHQAEIVLLFDA